MLIISSVRVRVSMSERKTWIKSTTMKSSPNLSTSNSNSNSLSIPNKMVQKFKAANTPSRPKNTNSRWPMPYNRNSPRHPPRSPQEIATDPGAGPSSAWAVSLLKKKKKEVPASRYGTKLYMQCVLHHTNCINEYWRQKDSLGIYWIWWTRIEKKPTNLISPQQRQSQAQWAYRTHTTTMPDNPKFE